MPHAACWSRPRHPFRQQVLKPAPGTGWKRAGVTLRTGTRRALRPLQPGNLHATPTCGPSRSPEARTSTQWPSIPCTCFLSSRRILRNSSNGTGRPSQWWRRRSKSRRENGNRRSAAIWVNRCMTSVGMTRRSSSSGGQRQSSSSARTRAPHGMATGTSPTRCVPCRNSEALAIQLRLERECDAAGAPRAYIFEELEILFRAAGNDERTRYYAARIKSLK